MDIMNSNVVEKTGKTVEEALELALIALDTTRDQVEYEVLEEPAKAFLGIFGGSEAKIRATKIKHVDQVAMDFLQSVLDEMNVEAEFNVHFDGKDLSIEMSGTEMALLIGRRGQTLDALQYLVSLIVNKDREDYVRVILDTENYREKRRATLEKLAKRLARKAKKTRKDIVLEPMNPYERRIIHSTLQGNPYVSTKSEGEEPFRKVIIYLNN
ncbi:RNA-binding cell elongation regulator Jag/EloR [Fusibacter sp. JL216-2]|uniref:RNA-binding cell elongation regulator Jag/EloR n=1 Tax=Fusibacter sp. JL216-2 TaxID=3071453 RepID=UPI003D344A3E